VRTAQAAIAKEREAAGATGAGEPGDGDGSAEDGESGGGDDATGDGPKAPGGLESTSKGATGTGTADGGGAESAEQGGVGGGGAGGRGPSAIPADIPDGKDDDIVARQIREAAMTETDPELREALWEEYRRYKKGR
jgi:hypothetical protein